MILHGKLLMMLLVNWLKVGVTALINPAAQNC